MEKLQHPGSTVCFLCRAEHGGELLHTSEHGVGVCGVELSRRQA